MKKIILAVSTIALLIGACNKVNNDQLSDKNVQKSNVINNSTSSRFDYARVHNEMLDYFYNSI